MTSYMMKYIKEHEQKALQCYRNAQRAREKGNYVVANGFVTAARRHEEEARRLLKLQQPEA